MTGQSPNDSLDPFIKSQKNNCKQRVPVILFIFISTVLFASFIVLHNLLKCYCREANSMITISAIIMEFLANCICYSQCIRNDGNLNGIWRTCTDIILIFKVNFKCKIHMAIYQKRILWKLLPLVVSYGIAICLFIPWCIVGHDWYVGIHFKGFQFILIMANAHVLVYIELLYFYLEQLNGIINEASVTSSIGTNEFISNGISFIKINQHDVAMENLRTFKNIHFRLWQMAQEINMFFGWILAAIIVRNFLDASYGIYSAFLVINDNNNTHHGTVLEMCRN